MTTPCLIASPDHSKMRIRALGGSSKLGEGGATLETTGQTKRPEASWLGALRRASFYKVGQLIYSEGGFLVIRTYSGRVTLLDCMICVPDKPALEDLQMVTGSVKDVVVDSLMCGGGEVALVGGL
ncbi:hypothetical protein RJ639_018251 [Escallonia herrerae]|uniref:Uncharacterized protein n=1 Tax=Escallonia herrerae TaxID=1293975 RepID=A0AA88VAM2_9ASTE|nr:hypothetical protein RJ639_018251 [Escallonia herrerae]